jgi:DNA-binding transcriptional LysR family regulator
MNLNHLLYFSKVVSAGSIKQAASELGLSPSTLSEHISQLESDLEFKLFRRQNRKLTLTAEGGRVFQHAKLLLESADKIQNLKVEATKGCFPANVGLVPNVSIITAYRVVADYLKHCGPISIYCREVRHEDLEKGLMDGSFDFGFSNRITGRKDLTQKLLTASDISLYVSREHSSKSFQELAKTLPLLVCGAEKGEELMSHEMLGIPQGDPIPIVASDYPFLLHKLCRNGLGIGVFTEEFATGIYSDGIKALEPDKDLPRLKNRIYVLWPRDAEGSGPIKDLKLALQKTKLLRQSD